MKTTTPKPIILVAAGRYIVGLLGFTALSILLQSAGCASTGITPVRGVPITVEDRGFYKTQHTFAYYRDNTLFVEGVVKLGYIDPNKFATASETEMNAMMDSCFTYDDKLRANGHFKGGEALQPPNTAMTLRYANGHVVVTDGPFAETKEQLGGIMILEARDLNDAVELISKHPGVTFGPWEIRPAADLGDMVRQSEARRRLADKPQG